MKNLEAEELYASGATHLNIGTGRDLSIGELARIIGNIVNFNGEIVFDTTKPDGTQVKLLDVSKLVSMGWESRIDLISGLRKTYHWYLKQLTSD